MMRLTLEATRNGKENPFCAGIRGVGTLLGRTRCVGLVQADERCALVNHVGLYEASAPHMEPELVGSRQSLDVQVER